MRGDGTVAQYRITPADSPTTVNVSADSIERVGAVRRCWQLLPYENSAAPSASGYKPLKVWWSEQTLSSGQYKRPICAGWVFQGIGKGELSDNQVAIRKATQLAETRFSLPMVHVFLHV